MKEKSIIFSILCTLITSFVWAQINKFPIQIKDDPQARIDFEILRTKDPKTGKIPKDIRMKELKFMRAQQKNLGIPLASGDIYVTWSNRGPHNVGGRTRALAVDVLNENIILAGGVSGGMWRSTDGGTSWSKTTRSDQLQSVTCIAQDPRSGHTSTWYYGTGEGHGNSASVPLPAGAYYRGDGIYKSTDNGLTWSVLSATSTNEPHIFNIPFDFNFEIVVNPVNGHVLVANVGGIYLSTDGGTSFSQEIINNSMGYNWSDVVISSRGFAYAAIDDQGIFSSPDGVNWINISPPLADYPLVDGERKELALAASNENILYVLGEDSSNASGHSLWHFDESTDIWTDRSASIPLGNRILHPRGFLVGKFTSQGGYDLLIKVKPDDENFVIIGGTNLFRSTNGFANIYNTDWIGGNAANYNQPNYPKYSNHSQDQHAFVFLSGNKALSGNDGGVQITNDITDITLTFGLETVDWTSLNNGYLTAQVYAVSAGPGEQIMAGFQDNSTWLTISTSSTADWTDIFGGADGGYSAFNSDGTVRFLSAQNANIYRYNYNEGANDIVQEKVTTFAPFGYRGIFITPFYLDPKNDALFYLGGKPDFYINTEANTTGSAFQGWKSISLPGVSGYVSQIGVTMSNLVYVGTRGGQVYKVTNPGSTTPSVSEITGTNFPSGYVSGIAANLSNSDEVLVTFSNYSIPSVFYSSDGGSSWTDVSGTLEENSDGSGSGPSVRTTTILKNGDRYFVGTSTGLYSTPSLSGSTTVWTQEDSNGIGNVVVDHVISRASDGLVVAGTHGNGIYSAKFETSILAIDLAVTEITVPNSGILSAVESITATIANRGSADQTGFTISLLINGTAIVSDVINSTLMAGASASYTFSQTFDFSAIGNYAIRVAVRLNGDQNSANDALTKNVTNANNAPTGLALSNNSIVENANIRTVVGMLSVMDVDVGDTHTYAISGTDAASFSIGVGGTGNNELQSANVFDFETKSNYAITITATDAGRLSATQNFIINVTNANEVPTNLALSNNSMAENANIGTLIGMLSVMDVDALDTHTYVISGTDAASFSIGGTSNNELQNAVMFVFNTKSSYAVTITAMDAGGLSTVQDFTINITPTTGIDNPDNPLVHVYPNPSKGQITIVFDVILESANWNLYDLTGKTLLTQNKTINKLETNIDITHLSNGIYLLKIVNTSKQITKQISIVR